MRDDSIPEAKGVLGSNITFGARYDTQVTPPHGRYGIEVLIESLMIKKNGSQSWVVISRSVDKYVTEFSSGMQTVHLPRCRRSAERRFHHRAIGNGHS